MKVFKIHSIAILLAMVASSVFAQSRTDAVSLYNKGLEEARSDNYDAAISSFEQAISIAEQLGPEGEDIKGNAEGQIPKMYYGKALTAYKAFQRTPDMETLEAAVDAFQNVISVSEEYNDNKYVPTAKGAIPQLYKRKSDLYYRQAEYDKADEAIDQAMNMNSNYALAYHQKAKIFKKVNDTDQDGIIDQGIDEMLKWYDQAISIAERTDQSKVANASRRDAHSELLAVGTLATQEGNTQKAIEMLEKALLYDAESANAYYRLAEASNKSGNYDKAVEYANTALKYERGGKTDKAKIYFELGYAQQTLGNKSAACDAFTNALYGSFKSPAQHKMEYELKCDSSAP